MIDSLYNGIQVVSPQEMTNRLLSSVYSRLDLQLPFTTPQIEPKPAPATVIVSSTSGSVSNESSSAMNMSICPQCNMLFVSKDEFLAHTKVKCARKLTCYTCGKLFNRVQGLALHLIEIRHGETVCSICGYEGESQKDAEMHISKCVL